MPVYMCVNSLHNMRLLLAEESASFERIQMATIYFTCADEAIVKALNGDFSYRKPS